MVGRGLWRGEAMERLVREREAEARERNPGMYKRYKRYLKKTR